MADVTIETLIVGYDDRQRELATNGILKSATVVDWVGFFKWPSSFVSLVDRVETGRPPKALITLTGLTVGEGWSGSMEFRSLVMSHGVAVKLEIETEPLVNVTGTPSSPCWSRLLSPLVVRSLPDVSSGWCSGTCLPTIARPQTGSPPNCWRAGIMPPPYDANEIA
jgi:hypothetical protein